MLINSQTLEPLRRDQVAIELSRLGRFDAREVDAVYQHLILHRAELYGVDRLDANETMVLTQMLEVMRARTADIKRPEFKARRLVPITSEVPAGAESWAYQQWDRVGMAKIVANYADDIPKVGTFAKKFTHALETIALGYDWSWLDMQRTAQAGVPLRTRKSQAVRDGFEQLIERIAAVGIDETGVKGLLNHANVPDIDAAPPATGTDPSWMGGDKTPAEVLDDLHAMEDAIIVTTKGVHMPDTILLPLAHLRYIAKTQVGSLDPKDTILKVFLEKSENIRNIDWWSYCDDANDGDPMAICYKRDPIVVHFELPMEQQELPPQAKNLTFEINSVGRIGGVAFEYPLAAVYMYEL